jgi:hypothetical protein
LVRKKLVNELYEMRLISASPILCDENLVAGENGRAWESKG